MSSKSRYPLHDACRLREASEVIRRLQPKDIDLKDEDGQTLLMCACQSASYEIAEFLLERGADVHVQDLGGRTALHWASFKAKRPQLVELLIRFGANPNADSKEGLTPLHYAVILGFERNAEALLHAGANPKMKFRGLDARALAEKYKQPEILKLFG